MKVKIKLGARISQDMGFYRWPACCPPLYEYKDEEYQYQAKNPNMIFDAEWKESLNRGYWNCTATGYGEKGSYGNGSIFVNDIDGVEKLTDRINVILQKSNSLEIRTISQYAKISDNIDITYSDFSGLHLHRDKLFTGAMPVGSVEFVRRAMQLLGINPPEFNPYPEGFYYGRGIINRPAYSLFSRKESTFIKPVELKRFNGFVYRGMAAGYDDHDYDQLMQFLSFRLNEAVYMSNAVNFVAEWRCYYLRGELLAVCRYDDNEEEFRVDDDFVSGLQKHVGNATMTVDIGKLLDNDEFCVVECNDAWAIGKYNGISNGDYFNFLSTRWHEIINLKEENDTH